MNKHFFFKNAIWASKKQNLMLISNPLKKLQQISCGKSYQRKSDRKMEFLTFITECKNFRPATFLGSFFYTFFNRFESYFTSIFDLRGSILSKKTKSLHPTVRVYPLSHNSQTHKACSVHLKIKGWLGL